MTGSWYEVMLDCRDSSRGRTCAILSSIPTAFATARNIIPHNAFPHPVVCTQGSIHAPSPLATVTG